ncbi:hypothetical protein PS726_04241 [Pseudomonas fluorescens]|nr:hypothetical protein PS726_04241 [Pseudomonas fluorescens]VVP16545.1 hypothetical protein PS843_03552 [Pseudomonas fluorescens]
MAWFYSVEDIGRISILQTVISLCVLSIPLGLDHAYVREYHESESKICLLKSTIMPGALLLVILAIVASTTPSNISQFLFDKNSPALSLLVSLCLASAFFTRFFSLVLRMQEKGLAFSMSQIIPKLALLTIITFYFVLNTAFDFLHLIAAHATAIIVATLVCAYNARGDLKGILHQKTNYADIKKMLRFGVPLIFGGIAFWGLTSMDKIFLRSLSTFEELGVYSVAVSFASVAIILQSVFSTVWAPTVYKWAKEGVNPEKIDKITNLVLLIVVLCFSIAGLFSWTIKYLLPEHYNGVEYIILPCMAYPLLYTLSETTVVGLGIMRKSTHIMMASIISVLVNLLGNYYLVPLYGAAGAAASTAIAFWVFLFIRTELSSRAWRELPRGRLYLLTALCTFISISFPIYGQEYRYIFNIFWIGLFATSLFYSKRGLKDLKSIVDEGKPHEKNSLRILS